MEVNDWLRSITALPSLSVSLPVRVECRKKSNFHPITKGHSKFTGGSILEAHTILLIMAKSWVHYKTIGPPRSEASPPYSRVYGANKSRAL